MAQPSPIARHAVAVVGGGQAGLAISWYLTQGGINHVVLEKERAAPGGPRVAGPAVGLVLPGDAELAVPIAGISVSWTGPARLHGA